MSKRAIYTGTFDIFTNGHLSILRRALKLFDDIVLLVAIPPGKATMFSLEERREMLERLFEDEDRVTVDSWKGLVVDYARENGISIIIRGLRPTGDFEGEFQMASMNTSLYPGIETVFLMSSSDDYYLSSSLIKDVILRGGDVSRFLPPIICEYVERKKSCLIPK